MSERDKDPGEQLRDRLRGAGVPCEVDAYLAIPYDHAKRMVEALDEAEMLLLEIAALPQCSCESCGSNCQVRAAINLAARVADQLRVCGGRRDGGQIKEQGRNKRRGFEKWVATGGQPSTAR